MANSIPKWEDWKNLDKDVQEYERHRILLNLDNRLISIESKRWKNGLLTIGGAFLGGAAVVGMALLGKLIL